MKNFYIVLEVKSTATQDEIKRSYRRLAKKYHPDKTFGDKKAEEKFKEIQEAYETLSDATSRQSYDYDFNKYYESKSTNNTSSTEGSAKQEEPITPESFYQIFRQTRVTVSALEPKRINQKALFERLNELLDKNCVSFLLSFGEININKKIINEVLFCCRSLAFPYVEALSIKLSKLAGADSQTIQEIYAFTKKKRFQSYWDRFNGVALIAVILLILWIGNLLSDKSSSSSSSTLPYYSDKNTFPNNDNNNKPKSGDLFSNNNSEYDNVNSGNNSSPQSQSLTTQKNDYSDWERKDYQTGNSPGCYNYSPKYDRNLDNKIEVSVGYNADVALKLINIKTGKSIRYVFIRSGDTYNIKNIPEGRYYLKIAYGKDWRQKVINGKCIGKFTSNALYKKGTEILDFNKIYTGIKSDGENSYRTYQLPSYSLKLDVIVTDFEDKFQTDNISEDEFNDQE